MPDANQVAAVIERSRVVRQKTAAVRATAVELRELRRRGRTVTPRVNRAPHEWLLAEDGRLVPIDPIADVFTMKKRAEERWALTRQVIVEAQALCARVRRYLMTARSRRPVHSTIQ